MIFVDTGAFFACFVQQESRHQRAVAWFGANKEALVTSDYILVELFTLLKARGRYRIALEIGDVVWSGNLATIEPVTTADLSSAWTVYKTFDDKRWSFVDCISRVVMERLEIRCAFTFDEHFRQFGTVAVVP